MNTARGVLYEFLKLNCVVAVVSFILLNAERLIKSLSRYCKLEFK